MVKCRSFLILIWVINVLNAAPLQYLTKVLVPETSFENPSTNWNASDDDSIQINIGFNFPFNNITYDKVWINSNGMLSFSSDNTAYNNTGIPYDQEAQSIYPYWDDMNRNSGGTIRYETLGNASNRHLVISWNSVPHYSNSGSYSFQVVLYEDGGIRFRYDAASDANGNSNGGATIGVQEDTSHYNEHSHNSAINQTQDILYVPNPIDVVSAPSSCTKIQQIGLTTYGKDNSHPANRSEYQSLIHTYAQNNYLHGSGYVDRIYTSGSSNNDPYHSGTDSNYLAIFKGYIYFPETGIYKFGLDGDDALELFIDDTLVTAWYGGHGRSNHVRFVKYVNGTQGWHKIKYHMEEGGGDDNYYLYWQRPTESSIAIVPSSRFFHCKPSLSKVSCVISDPVNGTTRPKRIPAATIRYAFQVDNTTDDTIDNVIVEDTLNSAFDANTIRNLQIQSGDCDCLGVVSANNNGVNGTANGVNPVKLDFGTISANTKECGYLEVDIK